MPRSRLSSPPSRTRLQALLRVHFVHPGQLASAYIADGRPRTVTFVTDLTGQVIRRDEADNNYNATTGGDPHEIFNSGLCSRRCSRYR